MTLLQRPRLARKVRLRVVGGAWRPRHVATVRIKPGHRHVADGIILGCEVWTDLEWATLGEGERPTKAGRLPGFGWLVCNVIDDEEADANRDLNNAMSEALDVAGHVQHDARFRVGDDLALGTVP